MMYDVPQYNQNKNEVTQTFTSITQEEVTHTEKGMLQCEVTQSDKTENEVTNTVTNVFLEKSLTTYQGNRIYKAY